MTSKNEASHETFVMRKFPDAHYFKVAALAKVTCSGFLMLNEEEMTG